MVTKRRKTVIRRNLYEKITSSRGLHGVRTEFLGWVSTEITRW